MGKTLEAMLRLQKIEHQLIEIRRQMQSKSTAVDIQRKRLEQLRQKHKSLKEEVFEHQRKAGAIELELKQKEVEVNKLRQALNTSKTNKEYAATLTQLNSLKADNSKLEDKALELMQLADQVAAQAEKVAEEIKQEEEHLAQIEQSAAEETNRLKQMLADLQQKRDVAAREVPSDALAIFERIAAVKNGDAMARIEVIGNKPPYKYVCGGCNMSLAPEHANALRARDEIRFCDSCGRILYLQEEQKSEEKPTPTQT